MEVKKVDYLIIGNGIAGLSASQEIRKNDKSGKILLISSEKYLTYYRVKLSHYISKTFSDNDMILKDEGWYEDNKIEVLLKATVDKLDSDKNVIILKDKTVIKYNKLLLAMGSSPFIPPIEGNEKDGVFALRTLKDLKHIKKYFSLCEDITVIGGGLLGLEAAWAVKELGKRVNIVEFFPYLCPRQLDEELSKVLRDKLEKEGFNLFLDAQAKEILGQSRVEGLKMKDGRSFKTDAILISAGVRANLDIIKDSKINCDKGIIVNNMMETNINNIYAAGDVAEVEGKVIGLWNVASDQGKVAGSNMTGDNKEYSFPKPFITLNIGNIRLFSVGDVKDFDKTLYDYNKEKDAHYKVFIKDNLLIGAVLLGDTSKMLKVKKAVTNNIDVSEYINKGLSCTNLISNL